MSLYEKLSTERKQAQDEGHAPAWLTTGGYQLLKEKYLGDGETLRDRYHSIAVTAARHTDDPTLWSGRFFDIMWNGWLAPSTPVLSNMGTKKGMPVSCSGGYVDDSIDGFYSAGHEAAILTKNGFGTSSYLGDIRPRGSKIRAGGKASGVLPVLKQFVQIMRDVAQGTSRRGAWAGYLPIEHGDFQEVVDYVEHHPDDLNIGWNISNAFINSLDNGDADSLRRFQRSLKVKAVTGKGYYFFPDKVNALSPDVYRDRGLNVKASNLCTEITLYSDKDHTFTCVLSSLNLEKWDEWKDTETIFWATVFLDCVASEFIELSADVPKLESARNFTIKSRALGLGTLGFHSYLQSKMVAFESFDAHLVNLEIFKRIRDEAERATRWMAEVWGEPEWCEGYGRRNTHLLAVAPNTSSALICGGSSQGIEPIVSNLYNQPTSAGEINRANPYFIKLAKERGKWNKRTERHLIEHNGSVRGLDFLSESESLVFRTAYEIDQRAILRLASARQQYIDQAQSINLFFDADEDEGYIAEIHKEAFKDPMIKSLYYMRTQAGVQAAKNECVACEG